MKAQASGIDSQIASLQAQIDVLDSQVVPTPVPIRLGGTGQAVKADAFNALSPLSTAGDLLYEDATPSAARLPGNTSVVRRVLASTGTGSAPGLPAWDTIPKVSALTFAATVLVNAALADHFNLTMTGNCTLGNPSNPTDGQVISFRIKQGVAVHTSVAFGTAYSLGSLGPVILTTGINSLDIIRFEYAAAISKWCLVSKALNF